MTKNQLQALAATVLMTLLLTAFSSAEASNSYPSESGVVRDCARFNQMQESAVARAVRRCNAGRPRATCRVPTKSRFDLNPYVVDDQSARAIEAERTIAPSVPRYFAFTEQTQLWFARCPGLIEEITKKFWDAEALTPRYAPAAPAAPDAPRSCSAQ